MEKTNFEKLNDINVNGKTDKKGNLTYLSWAWAWAETKKLFPNMTRKVYETESGLNYFTDGATAWVKVGVTIDGLEHIDYLPVMDHRNNSIKIDKVTSFDVNKAIQRSTTKALALHGLGLYIYSGEDLPETEAEAIAKERQASLQELKDLFDEAKERLKDEKARKHIEGIINAQDFGKIEKAIEYIKKES